MRLLLFLSLPLLVIAQNVHIPPCEPTPSIQAEIDQAKQIWPNTARTKALTEKYPDDFFVHKAYIESYPASEGGSKELLEQYQKRAEANPADPAAQYLHARAQMGQDTPGTLATLTRLHQQYPQFAAVTGTLTAIYGFPAFRNEAKQQELTEQLFRTCPDSLSTYSRLAGTNNPNLQAEAAQRLRKLLTGRTDNPAIAVWPTLWRLEFKTASPPEHEKLQARVKQDLEALKAVDAAKHPQVRMVLTEGYRLVGVRDAEKAAGVPVTPVQQALEAMSEWGKKNPPLPADASEEQRWAYQEVRYQAGAGWAKLAPEEPMFLLDRLRALAGTKGHPDSEFLALADAYLALQARHPSAFRGAVPGAIELARLYADRGVRLDQVPALVDKGLTAAGKKEGRPTDLFGSAMNDLERITLHRAMVAGHAAIFQAFLKLKKYDRARSTVTLMEQDLIEWRKVTARWEKELATSSGGFAATVMRGAIKEAAGEEAGFYTSLGDLAVAEGRKLDALSFYQAAVRQGRAPDKAQSLWKELGGTGEGWQAWQSQGAAKSGDGEWTRAERPLPDFDLVDMGGKHWSRKELAGKTVLLNFWATWCGPCRLELPVVEKLHQRVKDRGDILVLTLNVDDNAGLVTPFLQEEKYTFPVLLGMDYAQNKLGVYGIPQTWLLDAKGIVRFELTGFDPSAAESWVPAALTQIETVRKGS